MHRCALLPLCALLLVSAVTPALAETHVVTQVAFTFEPRDIIILAGDTVRWEWTASSHTVTNGTGAGDTAVGSLFDVPLDSANTFFEFTFTEVGITPYFCRPHEFFDMRGTITVDAPVPAEPVSWGKVKDMFGTRTTLFQ